MKKVLLTQKIDAVQKLVLLASRNKKSSMWHPEWHFNAYSFIRLQTPAATNSSVMTHPFVPLHPMYLLCNSYYHLLISNLLILLLILLHLLYSLHLFSLSCLSSSCFFHNHFAYIFLSTLLQSWLLWCPPLFSQFSKFNATFISFCWLIKTWSKYVLTRQEQWAISLSLPDPNLLNSSMSNLQTGFSPRLTAVCRVFLRNKPQGRMCTEELTQPWDACGTEMAMALWRVTSCWKVSTIIEITNKQTHNTKGNLV